MERELLVKAAAYVGDRCQALETIAWSSGWSSGLPRVLLADE
jgi:hypothetical protein